MTAQSYEEFAASYAHAHGEERARQECPPYMRPIVAQLRKMADIASPADAEALRQRADRMDPDLTRPAEEVPGAAAHD
jgi:cytochrome c556